MILISHYILIDMSDFLDDNTPPALHLSDLQVTNPSEVNYTDLESFLTNSTNSFTITFDSMELQQQQQPFNADESYIGPDSQEPDFNMSVDSIESQNNSQPTYHVTGTISTINGNIPFSATLHGANDMTIHELNPSFSNISFTRETDNESDISFSVEGLQPQGLPPQGGKKKRSTKKRKGKKKRTTKKRKGKKKKKTMRKQRKRSKKRRGGYDGDGEDDGDDDDDGDKLNESFIKKEEYDRKKNKPLGPQEMIDAMNPKKKIYKYIQYINNNPTLGKYHIDHLADNYEGYEKQYDNLHKKFNELKEKNNEEAKKLKKIMNQIENDLNKMNKVYEDQSAAILFQYYLNPKNNKYNIHVNSGLENDITKLQQAYVDYIKFEASQIKYGEDDGYDGPLIIEGGKKKRKKNKSKKKQKK